MILDEESSGWTLTEVNSSVDGSNAGPFPSTPVGGVGDRGIPTGQLDIKPVAPSSTGRVVVQTAIVVAAAVLVGTLVFLVVRAGVASGSDGDEQDPLLDEASIIDPGPSGDDAALADSTRSGSRRSSAADGLDSDPATDGDAETDPAAPPPAAEDSTDADADDILASPSTSAPLNAQLDNKPLPSTSSRPSTSIGSGTVPGLDVSSTTGGVNPATSVTAPGPGSVVQTTTTTVAPTTTTTVAATTTTVVETTTTSIATTTTTAAPPVALIAMPSDGDRRLWETFTRFRANPVAEATKYCWTFISGAGQRQNCSTDNLYDLPASPNDLVPGPMDVKAESFAADGSLLAEDKISINLLVGNLADNPNERANVDLNDRIGLRSDEVRSADRYCWTITQGPVTSGEICDDERRFGLDEDDPRLDGFGTGAARIAYTVFRDGDLIGSEGRSINFR